MNPTLPLWQHALAALALKIAAVCLLAFMLQRLFHSAMWRRTLWQIAALSCAGLLVCELTGASRGMVAWLRAALPVRPMPSTPLKPAPSSHSPRSITVTVSDTSVPNPFPATPLREEPSVWWPGLVWLLVSAALAGRVILARSVFLVLHPRRLMADDAVQARVRALARRLGMRRPVRVVEARPLAGPMAFGVLRPTVCLPEGFTRQFTRAQQDSMLAHELAHLAAHDPAWHALADLVAVLLWWHPLVWWARRQLHAASEAAADEASLLVENGPATLAECLVALGGRLLQTRATGGLGIEGGFRSGLGRRVERLMNLNGRSWRPPGRAPRWLARTLGPVALVAAALAGTAWTQPHPDTAQGWKQNWDESLAGRALVALAEPADDGAALPLPPKRRGNSVRTNRVAEVGIGSRVPEKAGRVTAVQTRRDEARHPEPANQTAPSSLGLAKKRVFVNEKRAAVFAKLRRIKLDTLSFDNVPLSEAIGTLSDEARKRDPEKVGVNFLLSSALFTGGDPLPGLPTGTNLVDLRDVLVRVQPPLKELTLEEALEALVKSTAAPIKYSVEDYGVVLSTTTSRPQLTIHIKWVEVTGPADQTPGVDWFLGSVPPNSLTPVATNPAAASTPAPLSSGVKNSAMTQSAMSFTGLPPELFRVVIRMFEQREGVDVLSAPRVTTLSGRQAQIKVVDIQHVVTGLDTNRFQTNGSGVSLAPVVEPFECGPVTDVVPWVTADGKSIQMSVTCSLREFLGYDQTKTEEVRVKRAEGQYVTALKPFPLFRNRQITGRGVVWDGQTMVLSAPPIEATREVEKSGKKITEKVRKSLVVLITPEIIDAAGNRLHAESEIPPGLPPQK